MVDIHTHILPNVDDGSDSVQNSFKAIDELSSYGVTDIVLTPHSRFDYFKERRVLEEEFEKFQNLYISNGGKVNLYLGQEIYYNKNVESDLKDAKLLTLNNTKNVLVEFSTFQKIDILGACYNLIIDGFTPVIAHVERYEYLTEKEIEEIKSMGGVISVNSSFVNKKDYPFFYKVVKKLLKKDLVDVITSDYHVGREIHTKTAREYIEKKFGIERADKLFNINPLNLIK